MLLQPQKLGNEICGEQQDETCQALQRLWISMSYGFFDFVKSVYLVKAVGSTVLTFNTEHSPPIPK